MSGSPVLSRNALCPCGSQRRYKDCHGAITQVHTAPPVHASRSAPAAPPMQPMYRPSGSEWDHLARHEREACSMLMQRALKQQVGGNLTAAAGLYTQVLSRAPDTHDALHMLGAIELRRGNFAEAKSFIVAAMKLRPPYPDIEHNLRMVQDLERAARVKAGRPGAPPEELCEKALPILADLALRPPANRGASAPTKRVGHPLPIHLIAGVRDSSGDGAWLVRRLAALLAAHRPTLWLGAGQRDAPSPARRLAPDIGAFPAGGCHVFVGIDVDCSEWVDRAQADRIVVFCQPAPPSQYLQQLRAISGDGARPLELVFPSRAAAARFGAGHTVLPPPIATDADFAHSVSGISSIDRRDFAVGLIGAHWQATSPGEDAAFLSCLATTSGTLEIYDPGPLRYVVGANPAVRCRGRGATALRRFARSVDCLLQPAGQWWLEGDGRELFMAMAAGVPILCPHTSIFAEYIDHGVDGYLYDARDEAVEQVAAIRRDRTRRIELGQAAAAKIAALSAPEHVAGIVRMLVLDEPSSSPTRAGVLRESLPTP
jgi:glycosyltransferase involved in cell wall biosynthesis